MPGRPAFGFHVKLILRPDNDAVPICSTKFAIGSPSRYETAMEIEIWESIFIAKISEVALSDDPAHDLLHFERVATLAKRLCREERARLEIVVPAAWLHDLVLIRKDSRLRREASRLSAEKALEFLRRISYPVEFHQDIAHAIEAHSFSANVETRSVEAKVVQDADRLDSLGAIGIARCFATAGILARPFYNPVDPLCESRPANDGVFTVDHFFTKLFKIAETMKTKSGLLEARKRVQFMRTYLEELRLEI